MSQTCPYLIHGHLFRIITSTFLAVRNWYVRGRRNCFTRSKTTTAGNKSTRVNDGIGCSIANLRSSLEILQTMTTPAINCNQVRSICFLRWSQFSRFRQSNFQSDSKLDDVPLNAALGSRAVAVLAHQHAFCPQLKRSGSVGRVFSRFAQSANLAWIFLTWANHAGKTDPIPSGYLT